MNIAIYGPTGAGKTAVSQYLEGKYGYEICHPGRACREIAIRLFADESKTMLNRVNDALRAIDPNVWLRVSLRERTSERPVVVDGMRFEINYSFLKDEGFSLWRITAPLELRVERLRERGQIFDELRDVQHPGESELEACTFHATIENSGTLETLHKQIDRALTKNETQPFP